MPDNADVLQEGDSRERPRWPFLPKTALRRRRVRLAVAVKGLSGPEIRQIGRCREKLVYMSADNNHSIVRITQSFRACAEAEELG